MQVDVRTVTGQTASVDHTSLVIRGAPVRAAVLALLCRTTNTRYCYITHLLSLTRARKGWSTRVGTANMSATTCHAAVDGPVTFARHAQEPPLSCPRPLITAFVLWVNAPLTLVHDCRSTSNALHVVLRRLCCGQS